MNKLRAASVTLHQSEQLNLRLRGGAIANVGGPQLPMKRPRAATKLQYA